jgi:hypothetical protein
MSSPKPKFFRTLAEGRKALESVGINPGHMSLAQMATSYNEQLKRNAVKAIAPTAAVKPALDAITALKAAQVLDFERLQRDESVQSIEFLAVRQFFGEHDLADFLFNDHGSILSELRTGNIIISAANTHVKSG